MREIKFRAKSVHTNTFVYGYYYVDPSDGSQCVTSTGISRKIDQETLGQYTGLKDKNGEEIYEGDIVICANGQIGIVEWEEHDACFNVTEYYNTSNDYPTMAFMEGQPFEVIGNIHENPELLQETP